MQAKNEPVAARPVESLSRVFALDALRGTIMVLMALDHANHFIAHKHPPGEIWDGVFPVYHDVLTFLTRLVTHLAPAGFFLLMGAGMALFAHSRRKQGWSEWRIVGHFCLRALVLIAVQLLIVNRAWEMSPEGWGIRIYWGVLCALGCTMVLGSWLLRLPALYLLGIGLALLIGIEFTHPGVGMWSEVSHTPVEVIWLYPGGDANLWVYYPILPWLEIVVLGMAFGKWVLAEPDQAFRRAWQIGIFCLAAFTAIRALDGFGNIRPRMGNGWIDFLNVVKYPPSMTYTLLTTGVNLSLLSLLAWAGERIQRLLQPLVVFGRTPLLFYVLHLFLYAGIGHLVASEGSSIPAMLPFWLLGLLILFPLCWLYGRLRHRPRWNVVLRYV